MAYGDFTDLPKRIAADKVLEIKHLKLKVVKNVMGIKED